MVPLQVGERWVNPLPDEASRKVGKILAKIEKKGEFLSDVVCIPIVETWKAYIGNSRSPSSSVSGHLLLFSDSEDICNYPNDRLGVIIISCLRSYNPHQYRLTPMGISTKMAVFIEDCSICQCTACMNLAMCMEYYVKCNFKIYLNLNDFNPPLVKC